MQSALLQTVQTFCQLAGISNHTWNNLPFRNLQHGGRFNLQNMDVIFQLNLIAGSGFLRRKNVVMVKQFDVLLLGQSCKCLHRGAQNRQSPALCLHDPLLGIVVSVVDDPAVAAHRIADDTLHLLPDRFPLQRLQLIGKLFAGIR